MKKSFNIISICTSLLLLGAGSFANAQPVAGEAKEGSLIGKTVTFVSYGGIFQDGQIEALHDFSKKTGLNIVSDGPTELAKLKAQVEAGNVDWDIVDTGDYAPYVYCDILFEKLDFSRLDISKVPEGQVGECSVPAMNYGYLIVYKKDKYKDNPPTGWKDFLDLEKFPGIRGVTAISEPSGAFMEQILLADGVKKEDLFPADIDRALNKLRAIRDQSVFWQTGAQAQQMMESGEVDIAMVWSGRAMAAVKNGAEYSPVWNDWLVVMDQMTITKGSKNRDAAYALLNAYLGKNEQEIVTKTTSYSPINVDARPDVDELTAQWLTNTPEKQATGYQQNIKYWVDNYDTLNEKWAEFLSGN